MNTLNIMVWNDATVKGNDVECLVSIDMQDVAMLVTAELQKITGKNYAHWEVKGLTDEPFIADGVKSVTISDGEIITNQALIATQAEQIEKQKQILITLRKALVKIIPLPSSKHSECADIACEALRSTKDYV